MISDDRLDAAKRSVSLCSLSVLYHIIAGAVAASLLELFSRLLWPEVAALLYYLLPIAVAIWAMLTLRPNDIPPPRAPGRVGLLPAFLAGLCFVFSTGILSNMASKALLELPVISWMFGGGSYPVFDTGRGTAFVITLLSYTLIPALAEEILFRRLMIDQMREFGDGFAIIVSSLLFMVCHSSFEQLLPALAVGIVLGWAAVASGTTAVPVLLHLCYNCFAVFSAMAPAEEVSSVMRLTLSVSGELSLIILAVVLFRGRGVPGCAGGGIGRDSLRKAVISSRLFLAVVIVRLWVITVNGGG